MNQDLFQEFAEYDNFTALAYWLYENDRYAILTMSEIHRLAPIDVEESYFQKVHTFIRNLWNGCYEGLPDNVQRTVNFMEENYPDERYDSAKIRRILQVDNLVVRQAKAFIRLENAGVFDFSDAYDLGD